MLHFFFFISHGVPRDPHSFPTRRSSDLDVDAGGPRAGGTVARREQIEPEAALEQTHDGRRCRSEEHTSELQSQFHLVCRLLLEKKNDTYTPIVRMHSKELAVNVPLFACA